MSETAVAGVRLEAAKKEIKNVRPKDTFVDSRYQRKLNERRVGDMAEMFDADAIGVLCLSQREDGSLAVVDGQHRRELLIAVGQGGEPTSSEVFYGLSLAEEAALFAERNRKENVSAIDKFRARLIAGEQQALDMMRILERNGWVLGTRSQKSGNFHAVVKLEKTFNRSPRAAEQAVSTLTRAWGHDPAAVDGMLVEGLGMVFARYVDQIDVDNLVEKLAGFGGGPRKVLGDARGLQPMIGGSVGRSVGEKIIDIYNVGKRTTALPALRSRPGSKLKES
jgi:hypothetical protein